MKKEKFKFFIFRTILLLCVIAAFEVIGYLGMWINSRSFDFLSNKNYFHIRAMLIGDKSPDMLPRYLTQPYLGYIPYPGYKSNNIVQHNEDGYRGIKVPFQKNDKFRLLCLGGSTTYGFGVVSPTETFPAQLERLLNSFINQDSILKKEIEGVEVINAGIEAGNSAEELQQYLFKYRYYHPDAVVIHSGINDALLMANNPQDFQLDYTHYRRINFHLEKLSNPACWLLKSYFISFITIRFFYNDFSKEGDEFKHQYQQTFCKWTDINTDSILKNKTEFYPFYKNTRSLYSEIISDSTHLIVLSNSLNKKSVFVTENKNYDNLCSLNINISKILCDKFGGTFIPFDYNSIQDTTCWIDDCHLNAKGEEDKAKILLPYIVLIIKQVARK